MRLLILTQYFPPEVAAAGLRARELVRYLRRCGHHVVVVTSLPNHPTGHIFPEYSGLYSISEEVDGALVRRVWLFPGTGRGISRLLNYFTFLITSCLAGFGVSKFDWVYVSSPPYFLGITGWFLAKLHRAKMVFYVGDLWPDTMAELGMLKRHSLLFRLLAALEGWVYRRSSIVNAATAGIETRLIEEKRLSREKVKPFFNGVDPDLFNPAGPVEAAQPKSVFLYAGVHGYAQGLEIILNAAARLKGRTDIEFWLVGEGNTKADLKQKARDLDLPNLRFIDGQPFSEMPKYFRAARASIVPLINSPLFADARPSKLTPSWACEVPVIYCGVGEAADLTSRLQMGWVVPPEDDQALASTVAFIADNPGLAREAGARGREFVLQNHSWETTVTGWIAQLEAVTSSA